MYSRFPYETTKLSPNSQTFLTELLLPCLHTRPFGYPRKSSTENSTLQTEFTLSEGVLAPLEGYPTLKKVLERRQIQLRRF